MMHWGGPWVLGNATESAEWNSMWQVMNQMMRPYQTGGGFWFWQFHWILELVTWLLVIAFLAAAVRWMWKKGEK